MENGGSNLRVCLCTQGLTPQSTENLPSSVFNRLKHLEAEGTIDSVEVEVWGKKICRKVNGEKPALCYLALEILDEFRDWAERNGRSLRPYFKERTIHSEITGEERIEIDLPIVCLGIYAGTDLLTMYPHTDGDGHNTVEDGLKLLETQVDRSDRQFKAVMG